jgi:predicted enzyme related to lactoylglutathione lyase
MRHPNFVILYVEDPTVSVGFYVNLFNQQPVESESTFALFVLNSGLKFGLWSKKSVEPAVSVLGGGTELCVDVENIETLQMMYNDWKAKGLTLLQPPTTMDFGITFVAVDPDGHRLRVYVPSNKE